MSLDLDPKEVLQHLHSLGYCNISPELLKDFIKDLKKLIKYDQKKGLENRHRRREMPQCCRRERRGDGLESELFYDDGFEDRGASATFRRSSPTHPAQTRHCDEDSTEESDILMNAADGRNQECTKKENIPPRPPSSFIRPNVGGRSKPKSDPVALYHYYQGIWSQNPQPGEDPRAQLRWNIRHQMMGKQKPVTLACECTCCELLSEKRTLPKQCSMNSQQCQTSNVASSEQHQQCRHDKDYNRFVPVATSSTEDVASSPPSKEVRDVDEDAERGETDRSSASVSRCQVCGKRVAQIEGHGSGSVVAEATSDWSGRKRLVSLKGPVNKIRVVTEINFQ